MNGLIEGGALFALALGAVILILLWHDARILRHRNREDS